MLGNRERRYLARYKSYHETPPTFLRVVFHNFPLIRLLVYAGLIAWACSNLDQSPELAFFGIGLFAGMISQNLGVIVRFVLSWPLFDAIFDWAKVDELLEYGSLPESK